MINKIVAFGCSFVIGDAMGRRFRHAHYTHKPLAIYYLGKELGLDRDKCDIIAGGGLSNQYIYRKFYNYIADVKNQKSLEKTLFVFGWTGKSRWEFYSDVEKTWIPISGDAGELWHIRDISSGKSYEKFIKEYYKMSYNLKEHFEKSVREMISVQNTCKEKKLQYIMFDSIESLFKGSHWPVYNMESKNNLVKLLDKTHWVNWDGEYGEWATMICKNPKEYAAYGSYKDDHPSALSQKVWGDYLFSKVKSLYE